MKFYLLSKEAELDQLITAFVKSSRIYQVMSRRFPQVVMLIITNFIFFSMKSQIKLFRKIKGAKVLLAEKQLRRRIKWLEARLAEQQGISLAQYEYETLNKSSYKNFLFKKKLDPEKDNDFFSLVDELTTIKREVLGKEEASIWTKPQVEPFYLDRLFGNFSRTRVRNAVPGWINLNALNQLDYRAQNFDPTEAYAYFLDSAFIFRGSIERKEKELSEFQAMLRERLLKNKEYDRIKIEYTAENNIIFSFSKGVHSLEDYSLAMSAYLNYELPPVVDFTFISLRSYLYYFIMGEDVI